MRLRELPELELCLAYVPSRAELFTLDALGWFLLRTCRGRTVEDLADSYRDVMGGERTAHESRVEIEAAMSRLQHWGIVEPLPRQPSGTSARNTSRTGRRATTRRAHHAKED